MSYYAIYQITSGALVAVASDFSSDLPAGIAARYLGESRPDLDSWQWDPSTLGLVPRQPARVLPTHLFIARFTDAEQRDFLGFAFDSTKTEAQRKRVAAFEKLLMMLGTVNLDAGNIVAGVNYLETVGILTTGRPAVILS